MARPVQVDRSKALRVAEGIFWRQGFTATPMSQLLEEMKLGSGSFYAAFGSKPGLFARVIEAYSGWSEAKFKKIRATHQGLDAIAEFLESTLVNVPDTDRRKGCLLVNTVLELEGVDAELHQLAVEGLKFLEQQLTVHVQEAMDSGQLREGLTVPAAVAVLMTTIQGLRVESRTGLSRQEAHMRVRVLIGLLSTTSA